MLISRNLHKKSREVSIKAGSRQASFSSKGQATKNTTVKWSIGSLRLQVGQKRQSRIKATDPNNRRLHRFLWHRLAVFLLPPRRDASPLQG